MGIVCSHAAQSSGSYHCVSYLTSEVENKIACVHTYIQTYTYIHIYIFMMLCPDLTALCWTILVNSCWLYFIRPLHGLFQEWVFCMQACLVYFIAKLFEAPDLLSSRIYKQVHIWKNHSWRGQWWGLLKCSPQENLCSAQTTIWVQQVVDT